MVVSSASVCICTYNRAARLAETLGVLQEMELAPDCDVEIVVVDNNSTDDTRSVVEAAFCSARGSLVEPDHVYVAALFIVTAA